MFVCECAGEECPDDHAEEKDGREELHLLWGEAVLLLYDGVGQRVYKEGGADYCEVNAHK